MIGLLDVNVLIALAWPNHVHHRLATTWFLENQPRGWATCPLTESGFVRVSSNTAAIRTAVPPAVALGMLEQFRGLDDHVFWHDDVSLASTPHIDRARIATHHQVTDAHLLALAISRHGRLVTLDRKLTRLVPAGAETAIEVVTVK